MASSESRASAVWQGGLTDGGGKASLGSGLVSDLPVSWQSRVDRSSGNMTSPEELIAAAHASCFAMAFSNILGNNDATPEQLDVSATAAFEKKGEGFAITRIDLEVTGQVPGISNEDFQTYAEQAKIGCPVSGALKGNVDISVSARLQS